MKASELRTKTKAELQNELKELLRAQFSLRMQIATQQTNKTHEVRNTWRAIARVRTILGQVGN